MTWLFVAFGLALAVQIIVAILAALRAPVAFEDADGFHYGPGVTGAQVVISTGWCRHSAKAELALPVGGLPS